LALVDQAQLAVALARRGQTLFLVPSLRLVADTEQTATQETADQVEELLLPQLEVEHLGRATMEVRVTTTEQVMLLAAVVVAQAQLVEVLHPAMLEMVALELQAAYRDRQ
jgi:hypothetical protein